MAVRIVDPIPDPSVVRRKTCHNCGVKLEYVPNDIQERRSTDYTGSSDTRYVIDCPNCHKEVIADRWGRG
jgi:hypothetical protein